MLREHGGDFSLSLIRCEPERATGAEVVPPALSSLECFGHTGAQVLDTLSYSYDTLGSKDERWFDILLALAFALLMKFLYAVGLMISVQATAPLKIPKATSTTIVEEKQVNAA